ncbi:MAG: hydrogenase maturation protease, partial [Candidatus Cloacimonadota bacterium]
MKTLIIGLGNAILKDEGVGIRVVDEISKLIGTHESVKVIKTSWAGLNLLDFFYGYERVVIIDSVRNYKGFDGEMHKLIVEELTNARLNSFASGVDLKTTLELGKNLGRYIPRKIDIYAVEIKAGVIYEEGLSSRIEKKLPEY